jgi:accessory colonization factor AcfC
MRIMIPRWATTFLLLSLASGLTGTAAAAQDTLHVYGPGGPLPAMREAAERFGREQGVVVRVVAGPAGQWLEDAKRNADLIYSGSEHMMTDLIRALEGRIVESTITPLYLRPSAILVRPGNPKSITAFEDLLRPGLGVLVVQGAGQTGLWEDMAGRTGDIEVVRALRRNIRVFAGNSAEARRAWIEDPELDAWLIWNIWQVANRELGDLVPVGPEWVIYRDTGIALTERGARRPLAGRFVEFLQSYEGARIFARWGWVTSSPEPG